MHEIVFFSPMANNLSARVKNAMVHDEICHREPEFGELLQSVRRRITKLVYGNEAYTTVMFTGSGTSALDATISSLPNGSSLGILMLLQVPIT